jgi:phospholipase/lecithinase/hemolysin
MSRSGLGFARGFVALVLVASGVGQAAAGSYSQVVSFGDSLSDVGNYAILTGNVLQPPYYMGRASNGPIWLDDLASKLGLPGPVPSLAGGTDYAYDGATAGPLATYVPNVQQQVQLYLQSAHTADPKAVYTVWAGGNDFLGGGNDPAGSASADAAAVAALLGAGAKTVIVPNLPALGITPYGQSLGTAGAAALSKVTLEFDADLAADLATLRTAYPGAKLDLLDVNALSNAILKDPAAYGITDTTDAALTLLQEGQNINPNTFLFWDGVHPTATGHALIADAAFAALVPEPTGLTLAGVCLGGLALRAWRRLRASAAKTSVQA